MEVAGLSIDVAARCGRSNVRAAAVDGSQMVNLFVDLGQQPLRCVERLGHVLGDRMRQHRHQQSQ